MLWLLHLVSNKTNPAVVVLTGSDIVGRVRSVRGTVGLGNTITGQKNCFYTLKISIVTLLIKVDLALPVLNTVSWPTVNLMWNEVCETCHITRSNLIWLCCCFYAHDVSRACMSGLAQHLRFADPTCPHRGTKISKRSQLIMQTSREINAVISVKDVSIATSIANL